MKGRVAVFLLSGSLILAVTTVVFLWAKGYTIDRKTQKIERVGMISVKSVPDGARVILDGQLTSATNTTLGGLKGGNHHLRIEKEGYSPWEKTVTVKEEYVTNVNAVLVSLSIEIKPLTVSGAAAPVMSHGGDKIYFIAKGPAQPSGRAKSGIYSLDLTASILNAFRSNSTPVFLDNAAITFSAAESLNLSPRDNQLLIRMNERGYYLADLGAEQTPESSDSAEPVLADWKNQELKLKNELAEKYKLAGDLLKFASDPLSLWSPDEKKFLYVINNEKGRAKEYRVHNLADPLSIGERDDYSLETLSEASRKKFTWYPDSNYLVTSECHQYREKECLSGSIHLTGLDGTNNTQVYSGSLASDRVFPTPDGSKIIILTSFNQNTEPNLYAISLR